MSESKFIIIIFFLSFLSFFIFAVIFFFFQNNIEIIFDRYKDGQADGFGILQSNLATIEGVWKKGFAHGTNVTETRKDGATYKGG